MSQVSSLLTPETPVSFKTISVADYFTGFSSDQLQGKSYLAALKTGNERQSGLSNVELQRFGISK